MNANNFGIMPTTKKPSKMVKSIRRITLSIAHRVSRAVDKLNEVPYHTLKEDRKGAYKANNGYINSQFEKSDEYFSSTNRN